MKTKITSDVWNVRELGRPWDFLKTLPLVLHEMRSFSSDIRHRFGRFQSGNSSACSKIRWPTRRNASAANGNAFPSFLFRSQSTESSAVDNIPRWSEEEEKKIRLPWQPWRERKRGGVRSTCHRMAPSMMKPRRINKFVPMCFCFLSLSLSLSPPFVPKLEVTTGFENKKTKNKTNRKIHRSRHTERATPKPTEKRKRTKDETTKRKKKKKKNRRAKGRRRNSCPSSRSVHRSKSVNQ